ncbi:MAG: hypothetical protein M5U26_08565 [Planctomycetota bacterium]|nr:hypothetical protein [Planctomycetota bacterium]
MGRLVGEGTIKGRRIELDAAPGLPEGTRVRVEFETQDLSLAEKRKLFESLIGSCRDDPSFKKAVEETVRRRGEDLGREIDFDVAS